MPNNRGFTLIEVLLALVILSIALTAILQATVQNIKDTRYLQQKTIAHWVGSQIINEARAGILKLPAVPAVLKEKTWMLNEKWSWQAYLNSTPNPHIQKISVDVYPRTGPNKLIHLISYLYDAPA
jgi:general secretion pathway protein I